MKSYSLSQAAEFLNCSRETVRRRLVDAGTEPHEIFRGNPRYTLRDILAAWFVAPPTDPDQLPPFDRRAFYQGELAKRSIEQMRGELVERDDLEETLREVAAQIQSALDAGLAPLDEMLNADGRKIVHRVFGELRHELQRYSRG